MSRTVSAVDLFCGIGGMTHGLIIAGIHVSAGIDTDDTCRYAYEKNNRGTRFIHADIRSLTSADIEKLYPDNDIKVLVGCAPCQPFSLHTQKIRTRCKDEKWGLLYAFLDLIRGLRPPIVSMENVPQICKQKVFVDFVEGLRALGYKISWGFIHCPEYGIPQTRRRLVLLASQLNAIKILPPTHNQSNYLTVRDTIGSLEAISEGEVSDKDSLHKACRLSEINKKRIRQSKSDGSWRDWDADLRSPCHKKSSGKSYSGVYARMAWDKPSPTITTQFFTYGTGRFGHPEQDRALSLREGALLQTFHEDYEFVQPGYQIKIKQVGRHIGNAVPVRLGTIIGHSILEHLESNCHE